LLGVAFLTREVKTAAFGFLVNAGLAGWRVRSAGVAACDPALPLIGLATFGVCLRDATALVFWAAEDLGLSDFLAGLRAGWRDTGVDLTRKGLALGEGCSAVNEEGAVYGHPISPRTSITSRLNIICFRQA
jgi:hypothetical protein